MGLWVWAVLGLFAGFAVFDGEFGGGVAGLLIGVLVGRIGALAARLQQVEKRLATLERGASVRASSATAREASGAVVTAEQDAVGQARGDETARVEAPRAEPSGVPEPTPAEIHAAARDTAGAVPRHAPVDAPERAVRRGAPPLEPSLLEVGLGHAKRWLTTGNVPVKIGVVLSVFGVGFLVKEGIDRQWLVLPIELRLLLVGLFGIALLAVGWRLRRTNATYALSVQGGGIAVLYLVTYAAYALYALLPAGLAFAVLVVVTAAAGALAVLQNARALAVLGIVGGFMAPVLVSSGSGDHVALFSYYAILNLAIFGVAWFKAWRELNLLGFVFTFGIGSLWGYEAYRPELFASTEPFLVLFVLLYTAIPVLFALRQAPELRGWVDGTLVFGTPLVGFGLQSRLVADTEYGLALSALALAAIYVGLATFLHRRRAAELRVLVEAQLALGVAFVTVAVPLALDARWTSAAWALQGAAMVWLGFRQRRKLALAAGIALQLLSGAAYTLQPMSSGGPVLVNGLCLGALLLALAGAFSARLFDAADDGPVRAPWRGRAAAALLAWGGGWWLWGGFAEVERQIAPARFELPAELAFIALTVWVALHGAQRCAWPRLNALALVAWPLAAFGLLDAVFEVAHPGANFGWLAWSALLATLLVFLRRREQQFPRLCAALHASLYWLAAVLLAWQTGWLVERVADGVWPGAAMLGVTAAAVWLTLRACSGTTWPFAAHARTYVAVAVGGPMAALVAATLGANLSSPGDAAPLPYVPVLNPLELVSVFVLLVLLRWIDALQRVRGGEALAPKYRAALAGGFGGVVLTMAVARAVHHWAGVPFDFESLAASTVLQASLSIVWGAAALALMVLGARRAQRVVWLVGAALMTVVVAKLFLVDLGNTATLGRVVSFLGVGLLLLVVGYFAPVPPRGDGARPAALGVRDEA